MLAAVDEHQKDKDLSFQLSSLPTYGYLEIKNNSGKPITKFLMSDLKAGQVCYLHKSDKYSLSDSFSFTVSDGKNYILQTFNINITTSYNALPLVKVYPLSIQEGGRKTITEFEIDISDRDSSDLQLIVTIISPPQHGSVINSADLPITHFSLHDIKHSHVSYFHDDSDTTSDNFTFVITDGLNQEFIFNDKNGKNVTTRNAVAFPIKIFPVDDTYPVVVKNEGLQVLRKDSEKTWNVISKNILYTEDADTVDEKILYIVTLQPHFGSLELTSNPDVKIFQFTQKNIENGEVIYVLRKDNFNSTEDYFMFSVEDSKPNKIFNNVFIINWARLHFNSSFYNVSETSGLLELAVMRTGNKNLDFTASCRIESTYSQNFSDRFVAVVDEIHFKENDDIKFCIFRVIDNHVFEGQRQFEVFLKSNISLLGSQQVPIIYLSDEEDEPTISFKEGNFNVNETDEFVSFPIIRQKDLSQELSVLCSTSDVTAQGSNASSLQTGSDYRSRDSSHHSYITFRPGVSEMMCTVKIIDDNLFEEEEEFLLVISKPHPVGKIRNPKVHVIIQGPNDAPYVFIKNGNYEMFLGEQNSSVTIVRQGVDLSKISTVWCGSLISSLQKSKEHINSYYQITFEPFETTAVCLVKTDKAKIDSVGSLTIFIDSPNGCLIEEPNQVTITLKEKIIYPVVEFRENHIVVQENIGLVHIPIIRTGNTSSSVALRCITQDGTAHAREDYEEKYRTRKNSLVHFNPGQKESFCSLNVYDDETYEGIESFKVLLQPLEREREIVTVGKTNFATVDITDSEDITVIELEKSHYLVTQNSFPNSSTFAIISVVRRGDTSLLSKVRISSIDGSASSGLDYYAKSKLFNFYPGETKKNFEIEILYNKRRNWALSFTVILGPIEIVNAEIGNISKAIVTIPRVQSTESLILPSVPIVVSLVHYDDVRKGMNQDVYSGYPLVCITPCDINYPDYEATNGLCRDSGINTSSLSFSWEIAMPLNNEKLSAFEKISDSTLFTSAYDRVLDSIYFRPDERVRCIAQPVDSKSNLGIPLRSKSIKISSESGFCQIPSKIQYPSASLSSQPFIATLNYINSSDHYHPNKLHIHIEIPHEPGLLPLLSTYPLHNIEFLLMQSIYRQQHVCSNLLQTTGKSFLKRPHPQLKDVKLAFPYHAEQVTKEMQLIYQHLDLKKCKWSFDAWYSMSDLVEVCGGTVVSDFKVRDADRTYISVSLPFYVTYIFAAAPTGWTYVEHRTEIEFSFFYETFLWKGGSHSDDSLNASLSIVRLGTDSLGHLFFDFKTVAKFYGCFVLEHHTLPGIKSHLSVPDGLGLKFNLELLWSEQTFDGPIQFWKATSNYNLKDYSGNYAVYLIPCEVSHTEQFPMRNGLQFFPCIARSPQKFDLPITFQQTLRPKPVTYSLETFFQLYNDESLFLLNPFENDLNFQYIEYKGAFSKGENVYGRVFWSPEQELESAYQLKINEVLLCTGKNGFVPLYDPTGKTYGKGPQYGCLISNKNLRQKFTLLNRHNPDAKDEAFQGVSFHAEFIEHSLEYVKLSDIHGVDGFVFNTDPLYEVSSSQQWFLQVTYSIKPTRAFKIRRSLENVDLIPTKEENRTNIKMVFLKMEGNNKSFLQLNPEAEGQQGFGAHHVMYLISAILIIVGILIMGYKNPKFTYTSTQVFGKHYMWTNSIEKASDKCYKVIECKQKIKQTEKCKIRVYSSPKEISYFPENSSETEV